MWIGSASRWWLRRSIYICLALSASALTGCSSMGYYWQAIDGHFDIVSREQPIHKLLQEKQLSPALRHKLELIQKARRFASKQLDLTDNGSYTTYADLHRPYVTWNVIATPRFSVVPRHWCFVFAGCFNYRGYFHEQDAKAFAKKLKQQGMDVAIAGAWAYSTLGWFDDPVLNTMLDHDDADVVGTLFHELGHQTVYVKNDSSFNESFANTVELVGLQRWYQHLGTPTKYQAYLQRQQQHKAVIRLLEHTRNELRRIYAEPISNTDKQKLKTQTFAALKRSYHAWRKQHSYAVFDNWMKQKLNNAELALIATYSDKIPAFKAMLVSVHDKLPAFYTLARKIGELPPKQRNATLQKYAQR